MFLCYNWRSNALLLVLGVIGWLCLVVDGYLGKLYLLNLLYSQIANARVKTPNANPPIAPMIMPNAI